METYWVWEYGLFEKNPKRQDSFNPETTLEVVKAADAQATIAALTEALECTLLEKPLPNGEYVHHVACSGDRRKPAGTVGISCSCRVGKATIAALQAQVQELEEITKVICGHCCEPMEIPSKAVLQSALTQRTAERDTARRRVDELEAREVDVVLLRDDLAQRTAELEAAKRKVDLAEKKAWLSAHDVGFFSMWNGTDHSGPPKLALLCNDTFAWATADCEDVLDEHIDTIVELFKSEGEAGVIKWIAQQRNMKPMESVGKWLFGCDALKKERDDLQAELERVRGERDRLQLALNERELPPIDPEHDELRTLIAALPKVEFRCVVADKRDPEDDMFPMYGYTGSECHGAFAAFQSKETGQAVAALLQHRQGMEG